MSQFHQAGLFRGGGDQVERAEVVGKHDAAGADAEQLRAPASEPLEKVNDVEIRYQRIGELDERPAHPPVRGCYHSSSCLAPGCLPGSTESPASSPGFAGPGTGQSGPFSASGESRIRRSSTSAATSPSRRP